jgi:hypothetical protein
VGHDAGAENSHRPSAKVEGGRHAGVPICVTQSPVTVGPLVGGWGGGHVAGVDVIHAPLSKLEPGGHASVSVVVTHCPSYFI